MRRTLIGAAGAVAGAVLVLAGNVATRAGTIITGAPGPRPAVTRTPGPGQPGSGQFGNRRHRGEDGGEDGGGFGPPNQGPTVPTPAPAQSLPSGSRTVTGPAVDTPFGPVQVRVSFSGGRITDVQAVQTPNAHMRSVAINQYATPILHQEVLSAQSASVDLVSGATWTSEAYVQSLQAAIDQAAK
jgi:uncharacterized protein with FMN-binding domain